MTKLLIAALGLALLAACDIADFDTTREIPSETIPAAPVSLDTGVQSLDIPLDQTVAPTSTSIVNAVYLDELELVATSGDWGFLQSMDVYISSTLKGSTLPKVVAASVSNPGPIQRLEFVPTPNINLVPYVNEGAELTATATGTPPTQEVIFDGEYTLHVHPL